MTSETQLHDVIKQFNDEGRVKTFAEFIAAVYKDKMIEIYLGDSYEEISIEQISVSYPAVFCGKVIGAYRECLVINGAFPNKNKDLQLGNTVLINERAIRGLTEMDGSGTMNQMFLKSGGTEADSFRKQFSK